EAQSPVVMMGDIADNQSSEDFVSNETSAQDDMVVDNSILEHAASSNSSQNVDELSKDDCASDNNVQKNCDDCEKNKK
ncbi:MAG: hypothetical protein RR348_06070, partial [Clostridia bacterium]